MITFHFRAFERVTNGHDDALVVTTADKFSKSDYEDLPRVNGTTPCTFNKGPLMIMEKA